MKLEKLNHKHALTSWLKVILFACLMLAPIMSVVVRSLYVVCNKNAKDSYYGENINEKNYEIVNTLDDLQLNNQYILYNNAELTNSNIGGNNNRIYVDNVKVVTNQLNYDLSNLSSIGFYANSSTSYTYYLYDDENSLINTYANTYTLTLQFSYVSNNLNTSNNIIVNSDNLMEVHTNKYSYLDNAFDYSISQIEESQFYNWTQNTAIYTGVEAMTTGLGITGATVPILITYWFLLTVIYVVIDIVINLFTYITHFLNKKTN